jgi:hypothetical protein
MNICRDCGAEIEFETNVGWVDVETDGTYDRCPASVSLQHTPEA